MKEILHILKHTLLDTINLLPFLLIAFFIIELIEHKFSKKTQKLISKSGNFGPIIGSLLGLFPQCGFSVIATNLYITRIISLGTLISIYLSTSDEMLPILLSEKAPLNIIISILIIKFVVGFTAGCIIDLLISKKKNIKEEVSKICESEHCDCEHGIIKSTIIHTLKTIIFIYIATFIVNVLFHYVGEQYISKLFMKNSLIAPFITSLIGLIPNCAASITLTELFLKGAISFGAMISGLLTGSGVSILVLFKSNKNLKENLKILLTIYLIGVAIGIITEIVLPLI